MSLFKKGRSCIGHQKLLTLRGAPVLAPSFGEPKLEPQIERTVVKIWTPALIERSFHSMPKTSYCHELTVGCVHLLQKYDLRAQWLACGMERFPYISCMQMWSLRVSHKCNVFNLSVYKFTYLNSHSALCRSVNHLLDSKLLKDSRILLAF